MKNNSNQERDQVELSYAREIGALQLKALDPSAMSGAGGKVRWMEEDDLRVGEGMFMWKRRGRQGGAGLVMAFICEAMWSVIMWWAQRKEIDLNVLTSRSLRINFGTIIQAGSD